MMMIANWRGGTRRAKHVRIIVALVVGCNTGQGHFCLLFLRRLLLLLLLLLLRVCGVLVIEMQAFVG